MNNPTIDETYLAERALAQGRSREDLEDTIAKLALFIDGSSTESLKDLDWVSEEDFVIIQDTDSVKKAEDFLQSKRHTKDLELARELSRCTEWHTLLGILVNYVPENRTVNQ